MLGQGGEKYQDQEMIEKFESILMRGNAQVTNQVLQMIMRFMSSKEGRSFICDAYGLIDKLVQLVYKKETKKQIEEGIVVNRDVLIILLHSIFDYDERFMRERGN